ncbi:MAG: hypothetical protein KF850_34480, partial [Labilithrix sp.]|nr:hypothetical protein [Labilithrix sp.]
MKRRTNGGTKRARVAPTIASAAPVGCGDDPIEGRELPPHPEGQRLLRADLAVMREWLTREWLCVSGRHPVRDVWRRSDGCATVELQSLATSIARVVPKARTAEGGKGLLRDWRDKIIGDKPESMRGALFEVYMAGLFDDPAHPVRTVAKGQPGYDFAVTFDNGAVLRVSCKSRDESNEERVASKF